MKIKLALSFIISILFIFVSFVFAKGANAAPRLYLDPSSTNVNKDSEFEITVGIDVESQASFGADATINFSANDLELKSVSKGDFFPDFSYASGGDTIEIHGFFSNLYDSKSGSGNLAKIKFLAKKDSGSGTISFTCSGAGNDTQILDTTGTNILNCGSLNQTSLTFQSSSGTGGTEATPTSTSAATGEPNSCGGTCGSNANCKSGLSCYQGFCRNLSCSTDTDCVCATKKPTPKPTAKPTPTTPGASASFQPVSLSTYEPLTPIPEILPEEESQQGFSRFLPIAIGGGIALLILILAILIIRKFKKGDWPPKKPTNVVEGVSPPYNPPPNPPIGP